MSKVIISIGLFSLLLSAACNKKEDELTPTPVEPRYTLPQGSNAYDPDFVSYYTIYGSYFLYKFSTQDFQWRPVGLTGPSDPVTCDAADEGYVSKPALFVKNNWLGLYPVSILKLTLPYKVLLAKNLKNINLNKLLNTTAGYNHITISNFSSVFDTMSLATKAQFRSDLHAEHWTWIMNRSIIPVPAAFSMVSSYTQTNVTVANMYSYGFLAPGTQATSTILPNTDFINYIRAITNNTKAALDTTILKPANDTKGLVKLKYNALINYYKSSYDFDLQQVGNTAMIP